MSWLDAPPPGQRAKPSFGAGDWASLLAIADDEEFLREAYRRILGRECDIAGFLHHRELLRSHVPRKAILRALATSEEARRLGWRLDSISQLDGWVSSIPGAARRLFALVPARLLTWIRVAYERAWLRPLHLVGAKVDYLLHEAQARHEQLSTKLDAYVAELLSRQASLTEALQALSLSHARLEVELKRLGASLARTTTKAWTASERSARENFARLSRNLYELHGRQLTLEQTVAEVLPALRTTAQRIDELNRAQDEVAEALNRVITAQTEIRQRVSGLMGFIEGGRQYPVFPANDRLLVTVCEGIILAMPRDEWRIAAHLAFRGPLEPGVSRLFSKLVQPGMTVVDVGAHVGWYTLMAARSLAGEGKVYSFEPSPETFELLRANVQVNGFLETGAIQLSPLAVADRSGRSTLGLCAGDSGHNSLFPESSWNSIVVETTSLDEALKHERRVDIVKLDAEGAEPLILRGMREILNRNPEIRILMEFAPPHLSRAGIQPRGFLKEIQDLGLKISRIDDSTGKLLSADLENLPKVVTAMLFLTRCGATEEIV